MAAQTDGKKAVRTSLRSLFKRPPAPRVRSKTGGARVASEPPPNGKGQSLSALYRNQRDAPAPADVCTAVGLLSGATWGECIVRSQFIAATKHGDMGAAKEIADRLEGKAPSADAALQGRDVQINVVYV